MFQISVPRSSMKDYLKKVIYEKNNFDIWSL